jgi:hypothetical protein
MAAPRKAAPGKAAIAVPKIEVGEVVPCVFSEETYAPSPTCSPRDALTYKKDRKTAKKQMQYLDEHPGEISVDYDYETVQ